MPTPKTVSGPVRGLFSKIWREASLIYLEDKMKEIVPVIIPSYEPDNRLLGLLSDLMKMEMTPIILVNDGSGDAYNYFFEEAKEKYGVILLEHKVNRGKGAALKTAFRYCIENVKGLIGGVTADSDGQHTLEAIRECINMVKSERKSLILGVRDFSGAGIPTKSRFGNNLTRKVFRKLYNKDISDTQTGLRGIPKDFMEKLLEISGDRFEFETRMLITAVEQNVPICEFSIETIYDSKENHLTHFRPIIDSIRIYGVFGFVFGKFVLSSLSSCLIDMGLFQILCAVLKGKIEFSFYIAIATAGARIVSAIYNYFVNYFIVFQGTRQHRKSAVKYFILALSQMACSAVFVSGLCYITNVSVELIIKIPVDIILFFVSYQIQKNMYR